MANPSVVIDIATEFTGKKAFDKAGSSSTKLEKNVKGLAKAFAGVFAAKKILAFGKASVKAFAEDDAAAKRLGATLKNLSLAYGANVGTVNGFINRLEAQTGVLDDELRPAMDRLLRATGDVAKSQELLGLALDIAAGTGKSVTQVSQSLQKAYLGQTAALGRLGVGLSKAELSSGDFEEIQKKLAILFAGQATTAAGTYQGSLNKLEVAANNAKETIGQGLVDALGILSNSSTIDPTVSGIDRIANSIAGATKNAAKFISVNKTLFSDLSFFRNESTIAEALRIKMGTGFTTPMTISSQDTQRADKLAADAAKAAADAAKKAAAAKTKADKLAAAAKIKADKDAAANAAKLAKAGAMFDIDKIQIEAALKGKISDEEKLRLELQRAILNEDADLAEKLQKRLEASQRATAALQSQINGIKPLADPFAEWIKSLAEISASLSAILGMPINMSSSMLKPGQPIVATQTPNSPFQPTPVVVTPPTNNEPIPVVVEPTPTPATNNPFGGLGGNTGGFGFSLPSYLQNTIPQAAPAPVTVNVTNTGSVIMQDDFVKAVGDAVIVANTNGTNNYRPGAVIPDGG
jgi:hypothetical protein